MNPPADRGPGSAPLLPSLLSGITAATDPGGSGTAAGGDGGDGIVVVPETIIHRVPFRYWEKEAQYAIEYEINHPGEELPRNDWTIRFGDREAKLHHRLTKPLNSVDASRWDFENLLLFSTQFEDYTYIVMKHLASALKFSYVWIPPDVAAAAALRNEPAEPVTVEVANEPAEYVVVDIRPLGPRAQQTDNMTLPLGGTRATTRSPAASTTMFWCWAASSSQSDRVRESVLVPLDEQVEERFSGAGMLTNLVSVVVPTGNIHKTANLLSGVGHRATEKGVMAREDAAGLRAPAGQPRGPRIIEIPRSKTSGGGTALSIEESRFRAQLDALPGPRPLPPSMIEMLVPARNRKLTYFKLPDAMWSVVCLRIDAKGGWALHQPQAVLKEAIAFVEDNFPELVPAGKLQVQTVAKHYATWKRPPIFDANGRRGYLPAVAMVAVIAAVRGAMRYPIEMSSRLLKPVIKATLMTVDDGAHKKYLKGHGGYFTISSDWINTLCRKLNMPYKRATTHSTHVPDDADELHANFTLKMALALDEFNVPDELFLNADHSAVHLLNTAGYGRCLKGGEVASISHSSAEKRQFTLLPVVALSGHVPKWQAIFEGTTEACLPPKAVRDKFPNLYFSFSHNHWANMATTKSFTYAMYDYYIEVVERRGEELETTTLVCCLLIDCWNVWKSNEYIQWVKVTFNGKMILRFIDARMTGREQPLDVLLQAFIKNTIQVPCEDYLLESVQQQLGYVRDPPQTGATLGA